MTSALDMVSARGLRGGVSKLAGAVCEVDICSGGVGSGRGTSLVSDLLGLCVRGLRVCSGSLVGLGGT